MNEPRGPHASTGYWLKLSAQSYQRELDDVLRPLKLTTPQFSVLPGANWLARRVTQAIALAREVDRKLFGSDTELRRLLIEHFAKGENGM